MHNLCGSTTNLPIGTKRLLGLGLNYCIKKPYPDNNIEETIDKFIRDIRSTHYWNNIHEDDPLNQRKYIPKLYIKSDHWEPKAASPEVEEAVSTFVDRLTQEHHKYHKRWSKPNLTKQQFQLLKYLKNNDLLIVVPSDKNLGPVIMERSVYIRRCLDGFLNLPTQYERLQNKEHIRTDKKLHYTMDRFIGNKYSTTIEESIRADFFNRGRKLHGTNIAKFRATVKVHKLPAQKLRPVIAKCGTSIECLSKWLDYELQKLKKYIPTYIKNSEEYHHKITSRRWPAGTRIIAADATAMYDNIEIDHGIEAIKLWLDSLKDELPGDYPHEAILDALNVVMRNNLAEFGDCHFKQIRGTAMGTSVAVIYAGLYYGWHEKAKLLPTYDQFILDMSRFVDDMTVLWLGSHNDYLNFKRDVNNYGILKWTMEEPSNKAIFLDLDMTISEEGVISTRTFQKPMNLYLYIPPQSAHQDGLMKGIVYGELKRYLWQNTKREDYIKMVSKFFQRCLKRNWPYKRLYRIFIDANRKLADSKSSQATQNATMSQEQHDNEGNKKRDRVFLKLKFHPNYIPRKKIRELYEEELEDVLRDQLGVDQFTICYSRAQSISDCVVRSRLHQAEGETVSTFLGGVT